MQLGLLGEESNEQANCNLPITLCRNYLSKSKIDLLIKESECYDFSSPQIQVYGKQHYIPREQVWYADEGCDMLYSKLLVPANPWPYYLNRLRHQLNTEFSQNCNGALVNRYRNGKDSMGWHSDDEPEISIGTDVISISLGASRGFVIKHKETGEKESFLLKSGDLLIMHFPMQQEWLHSVPKRQQIETERLNLTFRTITPNYHQ
ncbi:2OG-Fe(II) oxygenase [Shewanella sp. OPT22]|nr:2OG-Fe(II) oxygenase [Shewanella sp. OPT22]